MRVQSLWTVNPDGTQTTVFWGNQSHWPDMLVEARPIPDSGRVMFAGLGHHDVYRGSVFDRCLRSSRTPWTGLVGKAKANP